MPNWERTTLGAICESTGGGIQTGPFGSQLHARDYVSEGIPSVMPQNIGDNRIVEEGIARISAADIARLSRYLLRAGDIVYSRRGDVERRALVRPENEGWLCGTGCLRVRIGLNDRYDSRFISYALGTAASRQWIKRHAVGATMLNLNTAILSAVPLSVPSFVEQRAIAEMLGALDDKIATNDRVSDLAVELADAEFARAISAIPMQDTAFEDVADIGGGGTPKTSVSAYWDGGVCWATPTDVTALSAPYLASTNRTITEDGLAACSSRIYPAGSILMTSRATIGAFAIAQTPLAVNQGFIVVNARDEINQWWLFHEMRSRVDEFLSYANGATFPELPRGRFKKLGLRMPTAEWAHAFAAKARPLHEMAAHLMTETATLAAMRDELLPLLMSGHIRVRDAETAMEEVL
jgi:type I restriction enzyme S subunit